MIKEDKILLYNLGLFQIFILILSIISLGFLISNLNLVTATEGEGSGWDFTGVIKEEKKTSGLLTPKRSGGTFNFGAGNNLGRSG